MRRQRPDEAERNALAVLKSDEGNLLALQILGHALLMQHRAADAVAPLEKAAGRSNDPAISTLYATALAGAGRRDEAFAQLQQTISRQPVYPPAFLEYSAQLTKAKRLDEATAVLENGLALAPEAHGLRMEIGFHHLKRNERGKARQAFLHVLAAAPDRPDAMTAPAKAIAFDGDYSAAADLYRRYWRGSLTT